MSGYSPKTILLIDDDPLFIEVLGYGLRHAGYKVLSAADGLEAVEVFNSAIGIDLVILDMIMPVMDGYEAYFKLKRIEPDLKIIMITGYYEDERVNEILADGRFCRFLKKPFTLKELIGEIEKLASISKEKDAPLR